MKTGKRAALTKLHKYYYNLTNPGSYGSENALKRNCKTASEMKPKELRHWLHKQECYLRHFPVKKKFKRTRVVAEGKDFIWQADLVDISSISTFNNNYTFILTVIDVLSKFAWTVPLKSKHDTVMVKAFENILKESRRSPIILSTDKGMEFKSKLFQKCLKNNGITYIDAQTEHKACVVERFNRTLKEKMWRYFTAKCTFRYIDALNPITQSYNNSWHSAIQMKPVDVNVINQNIAYRNLYGHDFDTYKPITAPRKAFKLSLGAKVRISRIKNVFDKGYLPNWTQETFTVTDRVYKGVPVYKLSDSSNEPILGLFYTSELLEVTK